MARNFPPRSDRRRPPPKHPTPPKEPWYLRFRPSAMRARPGGLAFFGIGQRNAEYIEALGNPVLPEPDEELPDSDLSDTERRSAIQRERWRRETSADEP